MSTPIIFSHLVKSLPQEAWPWVLMALRHDRTIWQSLQNDEFAERIKASPSKGIEIWAPGRLALLAIGTPIQPKNLSTSPLNPIEKELRQKAYHSYESLTRPKTKEFGQSVQPVIPLLPPDLATSGYLALALRERLRLIGSYTDFSYELINRPGIQVSFWQTPLACLYSFVPEPIEMLKAFVHPKSSKDEIQLALHALLSNPMPESDQQTTLQILAENLLIPSKDSHLILALLIHELSLAYSTQAESLAKWVIAQDQAVQTWQQPLDHSLSRISLAFIYSKAGQADNALNLIKEEKEKTRWLEANLAALLAATHESTLLTSESTADTKILLNAWEEAVNLSTSNLETTDSPFISNLINAQIQIGEPANRKKALGELTNTDSTGSQSKTQSSELLYSMAQAAFHLGDQPSAQENAIRALQIEIPKKESKHTAFLPQLQNLLQFQNINLRQQLAFLLAELGCFNESQEAALLVLDSNPNNQEILYLLGRNAKELNKPDEATSFLQTAVMLSPNRVDIHQTLAEVLESMQDWGSALQERKSIVELSRETSSIQYKEALLNLAKCAIQAKQADPARQAGQEILSLEPEDGEAFSLIGQAADLEQDYVSSQQAYLQAVHYAPQLSDAWLGLAQAQAVSGRTDKSLETLKAAVQAAPLAYDIQYKLGIALVGQGSLTQAQHAFEKAFELLPPESQISQQKPHPEEIAFEWSQVLHQLGHKSEACNVLEKAYTRYPGAKSHPNLPYAYAKSLIEMGQTCQALPVLQKVVSGNPKETKPYIDYAKILLSSGDKPKEALLALQHVLDVDPCYDEAQALLAEAHKLDGDYTSALKAYQLALETDLTLDPIWFARLSAGMGKSAMELGQEEAAIAALQEAVQIQPQEINYHRLLCEAYWKADLHNNALQTARSALNLDMNNPDTLLWFAEKVIDYYLTSFNPESDKKIEIIQEGRHSQHIQNFKPRQLLFEALNALVQATQLAPQRVDLLIRMAVLQLMAGEDKDARSTLEQVLTFEEIPSPYLIETSELFMKLDNGHDAAICLERAIQAAQSEGKTISYDWLKNLSLAYIQSGNPGKALETWQKATSDQPQEPFLYIEMAIVLDKLNQPDEALARLNEALETLNDPEACKGVHFQIALLSRKYGKLDSALFHALKALSQEKEFPQVLDPECKANLDRLRLAAELSRVLFDTKTSRHLLEFGENPHNIQNNIQEIGPKDRQILLAYYCLKAELALDAGEEVEAANALTTAIQSISNHPRILALQARFQFRQRDESLALKTLQDALKMAGERQVSSEDYFGLAEAAYDLYQWEQAIHLGEKAAELSPNEPFWQLNFARLLVLRAEHQNLCDSIDAIIHVPGKHALDTDSEKQFQHAILTTQNLLSKLKIETKVEHDSQDEPGDWAIQEIQSWIARGNASFGQGDLSFRAMINEFPSFNSLGAGDHPNNLAALFGFQARKIKGMHAKEINVDQPVTLVEETLKKYPNHPKLHLNAVLLLNELNYPEILRTAQKASNLAGSHNNELYALSLGLLAKIAEKMDEKELTLQTIHNALKIWSDEPRWHALAARAILSQHKSMPGENTNPEAIKHLETAVQLEPSYLAHYLNLGKALLEYSREDEDLKSRALETFNKACSMAPNEPEAWLGLAETYIRDKKEGIIKASGFAERAITLSKGKHDQTYAQACRLAAETALLRKNPEGALLYANQALEGSPDDTRSILLKIQALHALNQPKEALNLLSTTPQNLQNETVIRLKQAELIHQLQGAHAAMKLLNPLAEENPHEPRILAFLAKVLDDAGNVEEAAQAAQMALQANIGNSGEYPLETNEKAEIHHLVGRISGDTGQLDNAIFHLSEAIRFCPNDVEPYLELGLAYQKKRQYLKAQNIYQQATHIAPDDPRPFIQAGLSLKEGKDYASAESMLKRAAQLSPSDVHIRKHLAAVAALNLVHNPRNRPLAER